MAEVFVWRPLVETPGVVRFGVLSAQFGDGYKQAVGDGINNRAESWNLTFRGPSQNIALIKQFLDQRQGCEPFLWTPKGGPQGLYECTEYNRMNHSENGREAGVWTLTATFTQRFSP